MQEIKADELIIKITYNLPYKYYIHKQTTKKIIISYEKNHTTYQ